MVPGWRDLRGAQARTALRTCVDARVSYCTACFVYSDQMHRVPDIPPFLSRHPERCSAVISNVLSEIEFRLYCRLCCC